MKEAVAGELAAAYHSRIVDDVRANDFRYDAGRLTVHLAREFGFCYGVDRAVDYAYQARRRFPDQQRLPDRRDHPQPARQRPAARRRHPLPERIRANRGTRSAPSDVVILPAFGVTVGDMARLVDQGCTLVDTTCGSVLNVWKNVVRYAQDGFTAIIHGKVKHEETRATASQALKYPQGRFLVVLDREEAQVVCDYIRHGRQTRRRSSRASATRSRPGFDPDRDLVRIGCANQTTMLMSESLEIGEMLRAAMTRRATARRRCPTTSAPSTRSAAPRRSVRTRSSRCSTRAAQLDLMLVVGGYNSSNTCNLARICAERVPTFHIADPDCLVSADEIRHRPVGAPSTTVESEEVTRGWLPATSP